MINFSRFFLMTLALILLESRTLFAQQLSPAERLYARLAQLTPEQRQAELIKGAKKEGQLNAYWGFRGQQGRNQLKLFEDTYPFLKVTVAEFGDEDMVTRLLAEETASRHLTDVLWSLSIPNATQLLKKNLVARDPTPEIKKILPQYRDFIDPQNRWAPDELTEHGLAYNSSMLTPQEAPKTWEDLCKPQYAGDESFDPANEDFLLGMYYIFGKNMNRLDDWLSCIGKNKPIVMRGYSLRLNLMLARENSVLADTYLYQGTFLNRENPKKAPFKAVYTAPVMTWASGAFINRNTVHPYASALLADWALSNAQEQYLASIMRGPLTMKHPFFPPDVKIVTVRDPPSETLIAQLHAAWNKYIGLGH